MENSNPIDTQLLNEFYFLIKNNSNLENYSNYYNSLVEFIKIHSNYFTLDILKKFRLDVLIKLDPDKYIVDNPSISLQMESQRLFIKYETIESLAMAIGDTLWDMVTIYSRKDISVA
ncbi:hypothetical protein H1Z61_13285 [Bacillus aquiflavi]|uniref:Uncharacterized protein n=1 Tax=Bacillus aquiflavi TaxID=2672567 RepID=A0A6B3W1M4_9BACI|nr:hypothetical protein [Bacillus aquiflavi]MBA4538079.1 hypothetical protein [Bacillus aquiflavi]NEY82377.1 hypothetical protein [Bacillus aquiflavi]UAC49512.1 hypothetical protein K6959_06675 [Bacillus aquiflavi]